MVAFAENDKDGREARLTMASLFSSSAWLKEAYLICLFDRDVHCHDFHISSLLRPCTFREPCLTMRSTIFLTAFIAIVAFAHLNEAFRHLSHRHHRRKLHIVNKISAPILTAPECIPCTNCNYATFNGPPQASLKRHQMLINGPRLPGGDVNSLVNTKDLNKLTFSILVSAATTDEIIFTLQNLRSQESSAAPNSFNQRATYRINFFNEKGECQSTYLHLDGYNQCTYTLEQPYNVYGSFVPQVVVLNHIV